MEEEEETLLSLRRGREGERERFCFVRERGGVGGREILLDKEGGRVYMVVSG